MFRGTRTLFRGHYRGLAVFGFNRLRLQVFQRQFVHLKLDRHGVVAGEAGQAEAIFGQAYGFYQPFKAEIAQRIGADVIADVGDALVRGDQLALGGHVHAHEAGEADGRGADAHVHLFGASPCAAGG